MPIDFQDTVRGFEIQDLSITVAALRRWPDSDRLVDAFRSGYGECRPWPDVSPALFESLIVARALHQMNLTLNIDDIDGLESYVASHAERVRAWMRCPSRPVARTARTPASHAHANGRLPRPVYVFLLAPCRCCGLYADPGLTSLVTTQRCLPIFRFRVNPSFS